MSDADQNQQAAHVAEEAVSHQLKRDALMAKFQANPVAYLRQLSNAQSHLGRPPAPETHMLIWRRTGGYDRGLYTQELIDLLVDYALMLETQLAIDAQQFRQQSIESLIDNHRLDGFKPASA